MGQMHIIMRYEHLTLWANTNITHLIIVLALELYMSFFLSGLT